MTLALTINGKLSVAYVNHLEKLLEKLEKLLLGLKFSKVNLPVW